MAERDTGAKPTRDRILDAALAAFADRGVEATSLDSLAVEIGIRKQTILYWFPSKEQLLLGVVDHAVADLGARLSEAALGARPARGRRSVAAPAPVAAAPSGSSASDPARPVDPAPSASIRRRFAADEPGAVAPSASIRRRFAAHGREANPGHPTLPDRLAAVVDATFRLGTTHPELLAVVREVTRVGPPASTHLAAAVEPLVDTAAVALAVDRLDERDRLRSVLLAAGARVVGIATEAEVRRDLGLAPDLAWLRARRDTLLDALLTDLG